MSVSCYLSCRVFQPVRSGIVAVPVEVGEVAGFGALVEGVYVCHCD